MAKEKEFYIEDDSLSIASTAASELSFFSENEVIDYQNDFDSQASDLLLEQYKEGDNIKKLLALHILELQELEDVLEDLLTKRFLDTAFGNQLDGLGQILNEYRKHRNDEEYRQALYIKTLINNSGGTPEDIISICKLVYEPLELEYADLYPARFSLFIRANKINGITKLIFSIKPIGVSFDIIYAIDSNYFKFNLTSVATFNYNINDEEELRYLNNNGDNLSVRGGVTINRGGYFNILLYSKLPRIISSNDDIYLVNSDDEQLFVSDLQGNYKIIGNQKFVVPLYRESI